MKARAIGSLTMAIFFSGVLALPAAGAPHLPVSASPAGGRQVGRGSSTPEERARAVRVARQLEADPLGNDAERQRSWVLKWIADIPDISIEVCDAYFGDVPDPAPGHALEIAEQMPISSAAFIIEHPEKAEDEQAVALAGLLGALKTYQAILRQDSSSRWPYVDKLIRLRDQGKLDDYVAETRKKCQQDEEEEQDPDTIRTNAR